MCFPWPNSGDFHLQQSSAAAVAVIILNKRAYKRDAKHLKYIQKADDKLQ